MPPTPMEIRVAVRRQRFCRQKKTRQQHHLKLMSQKSPVQNPRNETDENEMAAFAAVPMNDELIGVESLRGQLARLMYGPQPQLPEEPIESSLPFIPWKIRMVEDQTNHSNNTTDNHTKNPSERTASSHKEAKESANSLVSFPAFSYLDLRRIQNLSFADTQAVKAQQELDDGNIAEARINNGLCNWGDRQAIIL